MNKFKIIPAIDLINGKCVRLEKGDYKSQKNYDIGPLEIALQYEKEGADMIHIVDLDGAKSGNPDNIKTVQKIAHQVSIPIEIGGGIRDLEIVDQYLDLGAQRVIIGTKAVEEKSFIKNLITKFNPESIVVGVDAKKGFVMTKGWLENSGIKSEELISELEKEFGVKNIIYTDIDRDGMLTEPNFEIFDKLIAEFPNISFVASGGVSEIEHVKKLKELNLLGVIIGKALFEKKFTVKDLKKSIELK